MLSKNHNKSSEDLSSIDDTLNTVKLEKPTHGTGFSLYLRFPTKINNDRKKATAEIRQLNTKIINVRIPRQKSANFCLVDFSSQADCIEAKKQLKKTRVQNRPLVVKKATTAKDRIVKLKAEKVTAKRDTKYSLLKLIANIKKSMKRDYKQSRSNCVFIKAVPRLVKEIDFKEPFPDAVEVRLIVPKNPKRRSTAYVTLPTVHDAIRATKQQILLAGKQLRVYYQKDLQLGQVKVEKGTKNVVKIKEEKMEIKEEELSDSTVPSKKDTFKKHNKKDSKSRFSRYYSAESTDDVRVKTENEEVDTGFKIYD